MAYYCYMLLCADGSYYTGWTLDPVRREKQHNQGRGAKYTRLHRPVQLVYVEEQPDHSTALRRERAIKNLSHAKKSVLAAGYKNGKVETDTKIRMVSPGRVNLLGEHVDYNDGLVLPAAIDRTVTITARKRLDGQIQLAARDLKEEVTFTLESLHEKKEINGKPLPGWAFYPAGAAWVLDKHGYPVSGVSAEYFSNLPIGAGLSSSAAVEVGFAVMWEALGEWQLDRMTLAQYAQEAEVQYAGVNCGLMDQFACANGVAGHALLLDTRSLDWRPVKLPANTCIVIADSGVRRKLVDSQYNIRHEECNQALAVLKTKNPSIRALRDASIEMLAAAKDEMPAPVFKRARHVISEINRVNEAVRCLESDDAAGFGRLMVETHVSLRNDYEVSCPELDVLVESAVGIDGCLGARLTGAGFGGCTVNLVQEGASHSFIEKLKNEYLRKTGRKAAVYRCQAADGAHIT